MFALFVRSPVTTQRGTAIATIACGVPLVAYSYASLPGPLAEAGIVGVPFGDRDKLAEATVRVLTDPRLWLDLHERSRRAHEKYFTWQAVASRFLEVLNQPDRRFRVLLVSAHPVQYSAPRFGKWLSTHGSIFRWLTVACKELRRGSTTILAWK